MFIPGIAAISRETSCTLNLAPYVAVLAKNLGHGRCASTSSQVYGNIVDNTMAEERKNAAMSPAYVPCGRRRKAACASTSDCVLQARTKRCVRNHPCNAATDADGCRADGGCEWRRHNRRSAHDGCYPTRGAAPARGPALARHRRIVSYSLFNAGGGAAIAPGYRGVRHDLGEYAYGLFRACRLAEQRMGAWGIRVYHDGSAEPWLARFRGAFPRVLRCVRVDLPPRHRARRYLGCLFRMLPADDPAVDVFLVRDLDDILDPKGLTHLERRWLGDPNAALHVQAERYDTPRRRRMYNLGWYGQKNIPARPSFRAALRDWLRDNPVGVTDRYTADEEFLTDVWVPAMRAAGAGLASLRSHPYRRGRSKTQRQRDREWRSFVGQPRPYAVDGAGDEVVRIE